MGESTSANGAFRYTGARLDAETGLYDFRARIYAPKLGRFMQADPIGYEGGINLYAYVNNDPLNLTDPSGFVAEGFMAGASNALLGKPISDQLQNGSFAFNLGAFAGMVVTPAVALFAGEGLIAGASKVLEPAVGATACIVAAETTLPWVGGRLPNAGGVIRKFTQESDQVYYRVFSGDSTVGSFLTAVPAIKSFAPTCLGSPSWWSRAF